MSETVKVRVCVRARMEAGTEVEMTREDYDSWCQKLDEASFSGAEEVALQLCDAANVDFRFGDLSDYEVDDFDIVNEA